jgi:hypothetical protein
MSWKHVPASCLPVYLAFPDRIARCPRRLFRHTLSLIAYLMGRYAMTSSSLTDVRLPSVDELTTYLSSVTSLSSLPVTLMSVIASYAKCESLVIIGNIFEYYLAVQHCQSSMALRLCRWFN